MSAVDFTGKPTNKVNKKINLPKNSSHNKLSIDKIKGNNGDIADNMTDNSGYFVNNSTSMLGKRNDDSNLRNNIDIPAKLLKNSKNNT